jgi:hypothetical protein
MLVAPGDCRKVFSVNREQTVGRFGWPVLGHYELPLQFVIGPDSCRVTAHAEIIQPDPEIVRTLANEEILCFRTPTGVAVPPATPHAVE